MVEATVITFRQTQDIGPGGELQSALIPVVTGPFVSGQLELEPVPQDEFSRDLVRERVQQRVSQMLPEETEVTVTFETGA